MEKYENKSCEDFTKLTISKDPVPGGGSVAALTGALGVSLGGMVASLTDGKKKYAAYQQDIERILSEAETFRQRFFQLMEEDMENFLPLSQAYGLPKGTEEEKRAREEELGRCLRLAAEAPLEMMTACRDCLSMFEELLEKGSRLALSDVGCGVAEIRAASDAAWLNALVNLNMIRDEDFTEPVRNEYKKMKQEISDRCERIYQRVEESL